MKENKERNPGGFCAKGIGIVREFIEEAKAAGDRENALRQLSGLVSTRGRGGSQEIRQKVIDRIYPKP